MLFYLSLLALGAILGSLLRFLIIYKWQQNYITGELRIILINSIASFLLGFIVSFEHRLQDSSYSPLIFFLTVGLLGSLSTFSTFILELIHILLSYRWRQFFRLSLTGLCGGFLAALALTDSQRLMLIGGFCGSLTTFSGWIYS